MMSTEQSWFTGGPSSGDPPKSAASPSLLSDWNSYAASRTADDGGSSALGFDIEAAVRTANDKVSGTFNVVSKGVSGSFQNATSNVPSGKSLMYFGLLLASGVFFIFIAFTMFLPVMVLMPQKFAICFTLGCALIIGSFFALKGPKNQLAHMSSTEDLQTGKKIATGTETGGLYYLDDNTTTSTTAATATLQWHLRVSKGVSGSFQNATSNVPSGKSLMYFGLLLASGVFFIFIAFTMFLPVMVLMPQKFAICFTLGCALIIGSFFALKGPKNQLAHMSSTERLPITLGFIGSMVGTIYVSMVLHSYILSVVFSVIQVLALSYYTVSYFPGGSTGLKFLSSTLTSSVLKCFGR